MSNPSNTRGLAPFGRSDPERQTDAEDSSPPASYESLRRGEPSAVLLPSTKAWLLSLPENVRPYALVQKFARIANLLSTNWEDTGACRTYLDSLLRHTRSDRVGFPSEVLAELKALRSYYIGHGRWGYTENPYRAPRKDPLDR